MTELNIEEFLDELNQLESEVQTINPSELFPYAICENGLDARITNISDEPSSLNLWIGPFSHQNLKSDLEQKYLKPKPSANEILGKTQRFFNRSPDYHRLIVPASINQASTKLTLNRDLITGDLKMDQFFEDVLEGSDLTAKNSTSLKRDPTSMKDFVKGRTTFMPFTPGGMSFDPINSSNFQNEKILNFEHYDVTPPGLERGMNFDFDESNDFSFADILSGDVDDLVQDVWNTAPEEDNQNIQSETVTVDEKQEKDVDSFLPETDTILTAIPKPNTVVKQKEWAHMIDVNQDFPEFYDLVPELAHDFPFELDIFQKRAVYHLENSESVFVAAHTSAGKTVVAEYAIALAQKHMTRAIYTSPIKALSNQKFRDFKNTFEDVGILTGDIQIRPEAACLIMTTEILRSMLYRGADLIRDVEFVIFDEVHYVNDMDRGVVWEEVIIMLPAHVTLILLSATVPNTKEFAGWVGRTKQKDIYVISTLKRPVPLEHHIFIDKDIHKIVNSSKQFLTDGYKKAHDIAFPPKKEIPRSDSTRGRGTDRGRGRGGSNRGGNSNRGISNNSSGRNSNNGGASDKNLYVNLISYLKKKSLLPAIIFAFSKKKCEDYAQALMNHDLTSGASEKSQIHVFIEQSLTCLKGDDKQLPQVLRMRDLLSRGIAVHHSGLLPILKEIVEILFTKGLVKVLFATETFAMGVNAPARTVVFAMIRKHDGSNFRTLLPGEYTQMSGRAGRRGLDATGMVIIACNDKVPEEFELRTLILGKPTKLESQFRVTYNMILNLLRVEAIKVEDMIKRSFSENATQKSLPEKEKLHLEGSKALTKLEKLDCTICNSDIRDFYDVSYRILTLGYMMNEKIIKSPVGMKALTTGRLVVINNLMYRNSIGIILRSGATGINQQAATASRNITDTSFGKQTIGAREDRTYWIFVLTDKNNEQSAETSTLPVTAISLPPRSTAIHKIECLSYTTIAVILTKQIKIDADTILQNKQSDLSYLLSQLYQIGQEIAAEGIITEHDWSKIRDVEFQESYREKLVLTSKLKTFQCFHCPDLLPHYDVIHRERILQEQLAELEHNISDMNLELLPDYHQRVEVLKELDFIDHNSIVQIKGRVACEINTGDELLLTELILDNFLNDYDPAEIVALLSCFVFQEKSQSEPVLTVKLQKGVEDIKNLAIKVAKIQHSCGLDIHPEDALNGLKFGLVEVVYEWARGLPFKHITDLTDVLEGSIVRCIVRLSETCREVSGAARLVGDAGLYRKMEEATELIRRDIVFAASLYF